ncbi:MAG: HAD-IA family hydrolase [Treponema sp.]|nr:HAD-IA family hydrolase [Treponema sp.]
MINTVILDFGGVLGYPISGNWFIPYDLLKIIGPINMIPLLFRKGKLNKAFVKGNEYLTDNNKILTEDDEFELFCKFYRIVFKEMKINASDNVIHKLANSKVYDDFQIKIYDDALSGITKLKEKYRVIIITDTWPSTKRVLEHCGIFKLLDGLLMSCNYDQTKETGGLFEIAIREHSLVPQECIYIDDHANNLENAAKAGFNPVLMCRRNEAEETEYPVIHELDDIEDVIAEQTEKN